MMSKYQAIAQHGNRYRKGNSSRCSPTNPMRKRLEDDLIREGDTEEVPSIFRKLYRGANSVHAIKFAQLLCF